MQLATYKYHHLAMVMVVKKLPREEGGENLPPHFIYCILKISAEDLMNTDSFVDQALAVVAFEVRKGVGELQDRRRRPSGNSACIDANQEVNDIIFKISFTVNLFWYQIHKFKST